MSGLPSDLPVPILIVQHLDPRHKSLMADILQRQCRMKVKEAVYDETIEASVVYIAPPNKHMLVSDGEHGALHGDGLEYTTPSGEKRLMELSIIPLIDITGKSTGTMMLSQDIIHRT